MTKPRVLFVCGGNIFRSRLAEAYAKSRYSDWHVSSAGWRADAHKVAISPWATHLAQVHQLEPFLSETKTQLTQALLDHADLIVFMRADAHRSTRKLFQLDEDKVVVWNVRNQKDYPSKTAASFMQKHSYTTIMNSVDKLIRNIEHAGWADVVDQNNEPRGFQLPVVIINKKSLWHRGCHAFIVTPSEKVLIEKRSRRIVFSPNRIDVSLGGHVDAGEKPDAAMLREIHEETGLTVPKSALTLVEVDKRYAYRPHYRVHSKFFVYAYVVRLASDDPALVAQEKEVAELEFISKTQLHRLLIRYWLPGVGALDYSARFYRHLATAAGLLGETR